MDTALIISCALLGLAGVPHCAAMCGPACAAATCAGMPAQTRAVELTFQAARCAGYACAGGLASAGVGAAGLLGGAAPALRPFWVLLHCAALGLGLWLALTGRQPAWMMRLGASSRPQTVPLTGGPERIVMRRGGAAGAAGAAGALWVAWPCGLLQSALVVAALCNSPAAGALAMGGFALASAPGLLLAPWLLHWLRRNRPGGARGAETTVRLAIRASGVLLAGGALVALDRDAWSRLLAFCAGAL